MSQEVPRLHLVLGDEELLVERAVSAVLRSARQQAGTDDVPVDRLRAGEVSTSELAELLIRFTGPELWWLLRVAHWAAGVTGASIPVPSGLLGVVIVAAAAVTAVLSWRWRWVRFATWGAVTCLLAWTVSGLSVGHDTIVG